VLVNCKSSIAAISEIARDLDGVARRLEKVARKLKQLASKKCR
jgi:predicted ATPase